MAYIQRKIDNILCNFRTWAQTYVDNIICRAKSLPDLLEKLRILFDIFLEYNISIKLIKSFFNYLNIELLGQQIISLDLTTLEEKFRTINLLTYLKILDTLKYYLGLTSYFCNYIHFYT